MGTLATKALASKLARASYYVLKNDVDCNPAKVFEQFKAEAQELALIQKKAVAVNPVRGLVQVQVHTFKTRNQLPDWILPQPY